MDALLAWAILLGGVGFATWAWRRPASDRPSLLDSEPQEHDDGEGSSQLSAPAHNPANLVAFLLAERNNVSGIDDVYAKLATGFEDASDEADVQEMWRDLGLTNKETPYLLRFSCDPCWGEMELIFNEGRLVQAGVQVFGASHDSGPVRGTYKLATALLGEFHVTAAGPSHLVFSDNRFNGYLRTIRVGSGGSTVFRVANLAWCERHYGPNSEFSLS